MKETSSRQKTSTKNAVLLDQIGIKTKPTRLISGTSDSLSNNTIDVQLERNELNHECQHLTVFSFEIFCHTNETLAFALDKDEICLIFFTVAREMPNGWENESSLLVSTNQLRSKNFEHFQKSFRSDENRSIDFFPNEIELIEEFVRRVEKIDPDFLVCYDMKLSLYYLIKRAKTKYNLDLLVRLSRLPEQIDNMTRSRSHMSADGTDLPLIVGRILIDLWKILRSEITLNIYTFDNVMFQILHERVPHYDLNVISNWFVDEGRNPSFGLRNWTTILDYGWTHSTGNFRLIHQLDLINKTSEFARIYGIEFYHVKFTLI